MIQNECFAKSYDYDLEEYNEDCMIWTKDYREYRSYSL